MPVAPRRNNAQHQPLTTVLSNIIREYPAGGGVLRELCQNADDAGATQVEFVLDTRTHETEKILHQDLAEYQGPALLAFNNSTFSATDFESLSRIGDSAKAKDLSSTGKFGRGFNSVYNWTDMPSILSGDSLLILDPHFTWSREVSPDDPGGPVYEFTEASEDLDMRGQLSAFGSILKDLKNKFEGTIIRLPLRTETQAAKSKIVPDKSTSKEDIVEVFKLFSGELVESLIFLRNVHTITLRINDDIFAKVESTTGASHHTAKKVINKGYSEVFVTQEKDLCETDFLTEISLYRGQEEDSYKTGKEEKFKYAISHHMQKAAKDENLQKWARDQKLFPWIAIATPVEGSKKFTGRLFTTLPLPIQTKHPVHIHGMFSITPDRANIHSGGDWTSSENSATKLGAKWNSWLFKECLPRTWARNLKFLDLMSERGETEFTGWTFWPAGVQGVERELWMGVLGILFELVVEQDLKLLPTICGVTGSRKNVLFALRIEETYKNALQDAGSPVSFPPNDRRPELEKRGVEALGLTRLSPTSARNSLSKLKDSLGDLPLASRMALLEYVLSDKHYESIGTCDAPLLPTSDGKFHTFSNSGGNIVYFPHTEDEAELFQKSTRMVDTKKLIPSVKKQMISDIKRFDKSTAISIWRLEDAASYCKEYVFDTVESNEDIITIPHFKRFINLFWKWIGVSEQASQLSASPQLLDGMWLVPVMDNRYHKVFHGKSATLDISNGRLVSIFFQTVAYSLFERHRILYPLYSGDMEGFTKTTTDVLRARGYTQDSESIGSLINWLIANSKEFVDRLNDAERVDLIHRLSVLARGSPRNKDVIQLLRKLRLFQEAVFIPIPSLFQEAVLTEIPKRPWISLDLIRNGVPVNYIGIKDIPVVLHAPNTIFIDIRNHDSALFIRELVLCPSLEQILELYVVPNITDTRDDTIRTSLVELALRNFHLLTQESKNTLSHTKIVPVNSLKTIFKQPIDTVSFELTVFFFPDEYRIPAQSFYGSFQRELGSLGMVVRLSRNLLLDRIKAYSRSGHPPKEVGKKAQELLGRLYPTIPTKLPQEYLNLRWLPAQSPEGEEGLYSAEQSRDQSFKNLVSYAMPLMEFRVPIELKEVFGWNEPLSKPQLLAQLDGAVKKNDNRALQHLILYGGENLNECTNELQQRRWIPGTDRVEYYRPINVFFADCSKLSPYFGTVAFNSKTCREFLRRLGVNDEPPFEQLMQLQNKLAAKGVLDEADLEVAIYIVKEVGRRFADRGKELDDFKAPDSSGVLRLLKYLTAGDPGPEGHVFPEVERAILHPEIPEITIKKLGLATFHARLLELLNDPDFEDDFSQKESSITMIKDTLKRYTPSSTFNEYLANAEDCGSAKNITWILDHTERYNGERLLVGKLQETQGPALFCCNDGMFTNKDFKAVIDIGVGSKREDYTKIGKFGRGALTMYHWTSLPSFISGDYFVIFDPEQKYLPPHPVTRKPRTGIKLKLRDMRQKYPDQLRPFEGIFGFTPTTTSFSGTIFRFPFRTTPSKPLLDGSNFDAEKTRGLLRDYYNSAIDSLLFLKNIKSISFREVIPVSDHELTEGSAQTYSNELIWEVVSEWDTESVPRDARIREITIKGQLTQPSGVVVDCNKWCVIVGSRDEGDLPENALVEIQMRERLNAKYGLAALISRTDGGFRGRNYMSLPLRKPGTMEVPVHVDANLVVQSNRQSIPLADSEMESGSLWNIWIFEMGVAPLYLSLIKHLMYTHGTSGYHYWPPYPSDKTDTISRLISTAFWKKVATTPYELYPPERGTNTTPTANLEFKEAIFNLLEQKCSAFVMEILLRFRVYNIVSPPQRLREDLKTYSPEKMRCVSPEYLLSLLRTAACHSKLVQIWKEKNLSMEFFSTLLSFLLSGDADQTATLGYKPVGPKQIIGCTLLPLASNTLGQFQLSGTNNFLVATTPDESAILDAAPSLATHPNLDPLVVEKLMSMDGKLNIAYFQFADIPRVYAALGSQTADKQKEWIAKVWSYYELCIRKSPSEQKAYLEVLNHMPVYFGTPIGAPADSKIEFLSPFQFESGGVAAIVEQAGLTGPQKEVLLSFRGLILLQQSAYPKSKLPGELISNVAGVQGVYRLLRAIERLAGGLSIEEYVSETLKTTELETLRELLSPTTMGHLLESYPKSAHYLSQLPIWPSESGHPTLYKPAAKAQLAPDYDISFTGLTANDPFINAAVAAKYSNQLTVLGVGKMSLDKLLTANVRAGQKIEGDKIKSYKAFLKSLYRRNQGAFSRHPLAVDGDGRHCMVGSLYDHREMIFTAAFRDQKSHFLHPDLRSLDIWPSVGLRMLPSQTHYLSCIASIEHRRASSRPEESPQLIADARAVFEYLSWDSHELQSWQQSTWTALSRTPAVPVQTEFGAHPEYRQGRMREVLQLQGGRFTTFSQAVMPGYTEIAWSQWPVLRHKLGSYVLARLPSCGVPPTAVVLQHLQFLADNAHTVAQAEIPAYISDIKAVYTHLQERLTSLPTPIDRTSLLFLNTDAEDIPVLTPATFRSAWACAASLCRGLNTDSSQTKYVRTFLIPYTGLLDHYRVARHVRPEALPLPSSTAITTTTTTTTAAANQQAALMLAVFQRYREQGKLTDVTLLVEGVSFPAHRVVLAAASAYWEALLTGGFSEAGQETVTLWELRPGTVEAVLGYIYGGAVVAPGGGGGEQDPSDMLQELMWQLEVANLWGLERVKEGVEYEICRSELELIRPESVRRILEYARDAEAAGLVRVCEKYVSDNEQIVLWENAEG